MALPHPRLELRFPRPDEAAEFLRAKDAAKDNPTFLHYHDEGMDFAAYLQRLREQQQGMNLPSPAHVPSSFLFAFDAARIVGRVSLRHRLSPARGDWYGHVGYAVLTEFRNRGYATAMLARAIVIARNELKLPRLLVTCDEDNLASIKVIERNGGMLEDVVVHPALARPKRRYWIG